MCCATYCLTGIASQIRMINTHYPTTGPLRLPPPLIRLGKPDPSERNPPMRTIFSARQQRFCDAILRLVAMSAVAVSSISLAGPAVSEEKEKRSAAPDTNRLTDANFPIIFDAMQPPRVEPWKSIPWHISIVEAAQQAEKEGKPVFLWQADGWPLGCG